MNHAELVTRAERWLRNTFHCRIVLTELVSYTTSGETPDAIGWVWNRSILVECKTSRRDFFADQKKCSRHPRARALGHWRFYLTPPNLISVDEIPLGWGLYEIHGKRIMYKGGEKFRNAGKAPFESNRDSEVSMLLTALSRVKEN